MKHFNLPKIGIVITALLSGSAYVQAADKLSGYDADLSQTSVSGISSGAFMTTQLEVAFSSQFVGAGIVAGGPYYCAGALASNRVVEDYMQTALGICMAPAIAAIAPKAEKLYAKAKEFAAAGKIDSLDNLKTKKIYLFSGSSDSTVKTMVVDQAKRFYQLAGVPDSNIQYVNNTAAGHAFITDKQDDTECTATKLPYINNCNVPQSQQILEQVYGKLKPPVDTDKLSSQPKAFSQREFIDLVNGQTTDRTSMSDDAYVYVPKACETAKCKVHVALHGCLQGAQSLKNTYYTHTHFNEIADANNIIVLYPQAQESQGVPLNPQGCWDFWGYSSPDDANPNFYTKDAPQMKAIMAMVKRLGEPKAAK